MNIKKRCCFLVIYALLPLPFIGYWLGGLYSFLTFYLLFSMVPLIDFWLTDSENPSVEEEPILEKDRYFQSIVIAYVPIQALFLLFSLYLISTHAFTWVEWIGFVTSVGLVTGGIGITLSHELMHKKSKFHQFLSKTLLVMVCYGHFIIEHVRGHHLRVATPDDPASSRLGESLYQFLPRTIKGSFVSAWHLEHKRLAQKKISPYSLHNQFYWIIGLPLLIILACWLIGGWQTALFFLVQSFFAILMLEIVNYIEHYGLERRKLANGYYEKVSPCHSWNANHWLSNMILLQLQRHSDHHTIGSRPYQILRHMETSPQLPSGYLGMIVLALFPFFWRKVMDKRALSYRQALQSV